MLFGADDYIPKPFYTAVEAGSPLGWLKYVTDEGDVIGINKFGESAPGEEVMAAYGFTVENVVKKAKALIA